MATSQRLSDRFTLQQALMSDFKETLSEEATEELKTRLQEDDELRFATYGELAISRVALLEVKEAEKQPDRLYLPDPEKRDRRIAQLAGEIGERVGMAIHVSGNAWVQWPTAAIVQIAADNAEHVIREGSKNG